MDVEDWIVEKGRPPKCNREEGPGAMEPTESQVYGFIFHWKKNKSDLEPAPQIRFERLMKQLDRMK